jgi:hypothetical protein
MSLTEFFHNLREIEVNLAWCHWNRLGVAGPGEANKCSTDPEALIVLTSIVGKHDLRLAAVMNEWLGNYDALVSIERLKRYVKDLKEEKDTPVDAFDILRDAIARFEAKRWKSISDVFESKPSTSTAQSGAKASRRKLEAHDKIVKDNRQLFLRLMFGVGSRADIIYYASVVLNQKKNPFQLQISAPHLTRLLHYNNSSIFRTLGDLEQAGVLMIDPRAQSGKNKVYLPNTQLKGSKDIFGTGRDGEKAFIDWFAIAKICLRIEALENKLKKVNEEAIVKSRMNDFIDACSALLNDACIDLKPSLSAKALYPALIRVGIDELQARILSQVEGIYEYIIG